VLENINLACKIGWIFDIYLGKLGAVLALLMGY